MDLGVRVVQLRSSLVTIAAAFDVLAFNRTIVTGLDAALDEAELDAILGVFRDAGVRRAFVQVNPEALDEDVAALAGSRGLSRYDRWIKCRRPVDDVPDVRTDLEIVVIGPDRGAERVLVETSEPRPDNVAQSHRNVTRMGFRAAYARQSFIWRGV